MDRRTLTFNLPTGQKTIKLFTLHPKKPWIAIVTHYNTFSLWNYQQKILIRSFNCNTLDENGNIDIKDLVFYDKHCLCYQSDSVSNMKNHIIFATNFKIFFYDYITDGIKQINESEIEKKNIKKISPYSESKICIGLSDGSLKLYDNKDTIKNSMTIKTIRGYHTKPISHLFTYCQSVNESPRVISVSANDGLIACWNLETILKVCNPSFKLQSPTQTKSQEIRSLQYDKQTYKLLTLTDSHLSIWNTMTGLELKRIRCDLKLKQIYFFNHFSYGLNSFIGFGEGSIVRIMRISSTTGKLLIVDEINLKNMIKQSQLLSIKHIFNWASSPSQLFIETQSGIVAIEINLSYRPFLGFNNSFITRLSTINSKQFIIKGKNENRINPDLTLSQGRNARFESGILFNSFYLSLEEDWVYFNLIQIQIENMFHERNKYKFFKLDSSSLFFPFEGPQSVIDVSFDGKSLILFNRALFYYEIYSVIENEQSGNLLDVHESVQSIDFCSKFELITKGICRDIVWHQYKNQYAAICPFDKNGQLITFHKQKQKKGIFSRPSKQEKSVDKMLKEADHLCACIFVFTRKARKYLMVEKSKPIKSQMNKILNFGNVFCYSSQQKSTIETIECISEDQALVKQIQGIGLFPLKVILSFCQTYQIFVYESYFIIFKLQQNGCMVYHSTIHEKVIEGIFWEKFFIFSTKCQIYFMQITAKSKILVKLADTIVNYALQKNKPPFEADFIDDLEPEVGVMPQGQLQFLTVVNLHLVAVNQNDEVVLFPLNTNPYVQLCVQMVCGATQKIGKIYKKFSSQIKELIKQTLLEYGLNLPKIEPVSSEVIF